jgi:hypothetical protein
MSARSPIYIDDGSPLTSTDTSCDDNRVSMPLVPNGRARKLVVSLPRISSERKLLYKPLNKSSLGADFEARVDEVIGEYREGSILYYFARYDGGIARKVRVLKVNTFISQQIDCYLTSTWRRHSLVIMGP